MIEPHGDVADVEEQRTPVDPQLDKADDELDVDGSLPSEADPADVIDQRRAVPDMGRFD